MPWYGQYHFGIIVCCNKIYCNIIASKKSPKSPNAIFFKKIYNSLYINKLSGFWSKKVPKIFFGDFFISYISVNQSIKKYFLKILKKKPKSPQEKCKSPREKSKSPRKFWGLFTNFWGLFLAVFWRIIL